MGFDKLSAPIAGRSVAVRALEGFLEISAFREIIIVCDDDRCDSQFTGIDFGGRQFRHVHGGAERHHSVANGLAAVSAPSSWVAIHDAARPLVRSSEIRRVIEALADHPAAALAHRVSETLKRADNHDLTCGAVERDGLWRMETPQMFALELLREAYQKVISEGRLVTDEVSAMEFLGIPTKLIESRHPNLKLTTPADLSLAEAMWRADPPRPS